MRPGAVVMMDALGFKGIWKKHQAGIVLDAMQLMKLSATVQHASFLERAKALGAPPELTPVVTYRFLSDTAIIGVQSPEGNSIPEHLLIYAAATAASAVMATATSPTFTLVFRGAITFGEFAVADNFIIGPAIDDAATDQNSAEGGFVWLHPGCQRRVLGEDEPGWPWLTWTVPMKGGAAYRTRVVTPFMRGFGPGRHDSIRKSIVGFFDDDRLDVQIKRQNTECFLDAAIGVAPKQ
jgi:hypothetical protein